MINIVPGLLTIGLLSCLKGCYSKKEITEEKKEKLVLLRNEIKENLITNLLPYWSAKMIDTVNEDSTEELTGRKRCIPMLRREVFEVIERIKE